MALTVYAKRALEKTKMQNKTVEYKMNGQNSNNKRK